MLTLSWTRCKAAEVTCTLPLIEHSTTPLSVGGIERRNTNRFRKIVDDVLLQLLNREPILASGLWSDKLSTEDVCCIPYHHFAEGKEVTGRREIHRRRCCQQL